MDPRIFDLDSSKDSEEGIDKSFEDLSEQKEKEIKEINIISNENISNKRRLVRFMYKKLHSESLIKENE